jgi:hypothetical protein
MMVSKYLVTLLLYVIAIVPTFGQNNIVGNWKRVQTVIKNQCVKINQWQWGDLEIHSDSTFHIYGDSTNQNSATPTGWQAGTEYNGTWELRDSNYLRLRILYQPDWIFRSYEIIKLTKERLVLRSNASKNNKQIISYLRLF